MQECLLRTPHFLLLLVKPKCKSLEGNGCSPGGCYCARALDTRHHLGIQTEEAGELPAFPFEIPTPRDRKAAFAAQVFIVRLEILSKIKGKGKCIEGIH